MGLGSSGTGAEAAKYYLKHGHEVHILRSTNDSGTEELETLGAVFVTREEAVKMAGEADLVVKLPGVPLPYEVKRKARKITNDLAVLLEHPDTERMTRIMILGGKGKTMTASALSHALGQLGVRNAFSEGVGFSAFHLLSAIESGVKFNVIILEMSKWHIRDTDEILGHKWPRIDLLGITDNLQLSVFPSDMSPEGLLVSGPWTQQVVLSKKLRKRLLFSGLVKKDKLQAFPSRSNPSKGVGGQELAWELLRALGYKKKAIQDCFKNYHGVPNRMELVLVKDGISFINDSASVLPMSVPFSMQSLSTPYVHVIAGGDDKSKSDLDDMAASLQKAISVTLLQGSLTEKLIPLLRREGTAFSGPFKSMDEAVSASYQAAVKHRGERDIAEFILLSPGAYAGAQWANEFARGHAFSQAVRQLFSL